MIAIPIPLCALIGWLNGVVVGFFFGAFQVQGCCTALTTAQIMWIALVLAGLAMLASLFVLCVLRGFTFTSVLLPVFINAVIVAVAVVFVLRAIGMSEWSILVGVVIGAVIGLLIGWLLCFLCDRRFLAAGG
jgi:hypothetical protein